MAQSSTTVTAREAPCDFWVVLYVQRLRFAIVLGMGLALMPAGARLALDDVILSVGLASALAALVVIDLDRYRLPDALTLPLIAAGVVLVPPNDLLSVLERLMAALTGFFTVYGVHIGYRRSIGREGIGLGDAKLFAAAGAWCTLWGLPSVMLLASVTALAVVLTHAYVRGGLPTRTTRIAFGPYLAFAIWVVWLFGPLL